jgi:hypothetical protein
MDYDEEENYTFAQLAYLENVDNIQCCLDSVMSCLLDSSPEEIKKAGAYLKEANELFEKISSQSMEEGEDE